MSDFNATSEIAPGAGFTQVGQEFDFGFEVWSVIRRDTNPSTNSSVEWSAATSAYAVFAIAVRAGAALTVADATHSNTADGIALTQAHTLTVADAFHAHTADTVLSQEPGATVPGYPWLLEDGTEWLLEDGTNWLLEVPYVQFTIGVATAVFAVGVKTTTPTLAVGAAHTHVGVSASQAAGVKAATGAASSLQANVAVHVSVVGTREATPTISVPVALNAATAAGVKDTTGAATPAVAVQASGRGSSSLNPEGRAQSHLAVAATVPATKQAAGNPTPQLAITASATGTKSDVGAVGGAVLAQLRLTASLTGQRATTGTARNQIGLTSSAIRFKEATGTATPLVAITAQIGFRVAHTGQVVAYLGIMGARSTMSGRIRLPFVSQLETADHVLEGANA
jgi:hypothetical protein